MKSIETARIVRASSPSKQHPIRTFYTIPCKQFITGFFIATLLLFAVPAYTQDIDDVMDSLDQDFRFGGKEDIKQNNKSNTNEALREDTAITNSQPGQVELVLFIKEYGMGGPSISLEIIASNIPTFTFGESTLHLGTFQANSTRLMKITCNNGPCEFYIFIVKGALFSPSQLEDTGPTTILLSDSQMTTLSFKMNKDNSGQARPVPTPPPPIPS